MGYDSAVVNDHASSCATELDPHLFGDDSPCFGCSPLHPTGFRLTFSREGDAVCTRFTPRADHQGPPTIMHGGLVTALGDELAAWTIIGLKGRMGFTASIEARLLRPLRVGVEAVGRGRITKDGGRVVEVAVMLAQRDEEVFRGQFQFVLVDRRGAERILGGPLPEPWLRFCRDGA
jgi:acyl-coenzyme A thioesterase PaaI-like protein